MAEYGIPYMGSKSSICNKLCAIFPKADHFYDLFGGGFSVTNAMILRRSRDYKTFHFNELRPGICELIKSAIAGDFNYNKFSPPFVSRDEFMAKKESDPYIKFCWSFGNNGQDYLFSKEIEPFKKSIHNAIMFNQFDDLAVKTLGMNEFKDGYSVNERRLFVRNRIEFFRLTKIPDFLHKFLNEKQLQQLQRLQRLEQLQQLLQLERLQQLQQLERLERLEFYNTTYDQVPIKDNSIIYCDPPYSVPVADDYFDDGSTFDQRAFLNWCDSQTNPVFISEYVIRDKRFSPILQIKKRNLFTTGAASKLEKVFVNRAGLAVLRSGYRPPPPAAQSAPEPE